MDRQNLLKLEAEEIGDKEAEESPVESEDDEANAEVASLETTEKRKERLKRLLHEKCKKYNEEKKIKHDSNQVIINLDDKPATNLDNDKDDSTNLQKENKVNKENELVQRNIDNENQNNTKINNSKEVTDNEKTNIDVRFSEPLSTKSVSNTDNNIQLVSDDSNIIESDIDELHLLQKLHSENEVYTSTLDSSDTDTQNAMSDTLDSGSDNKKPPSDDVISIENSSFSESEMNIEHHDSVDKGIRDHSPKENVMDEVKADDNMKSAEEHIENVLNKSNNDEYNDSVENILLASSEEDEDNVNKDIIEKDDVCVNLRDDSISIGETVIERKKNEATPDISIGVTVIENQNNEAILKEQQTDVTVINTPKNVMNESTRVSESSRPSEISIDHSEMEIIEDKTIGDEIIKPVN